MRAKERKEKVALDIKQKRKEERELKRVEKEKERELKKREQDEKRQRGKRGRMCQNKDVTTPRKKACTEDRHLGAEELEDNTSDYGEPGPSRLVQSPHCCMQEEDSSNHEEPGPGPSTRASRSVQPPRRYAQESDSDSDASDTVCMVCGCREPPVDEPVVFWVDCDECKEWAHSYCAFGNNACFTARKFICSLCVAD